MVSKKGRRHSSKRSKHCKGGRKSGKHLRTEKKHNKWYQKGCQSGGGSITGGWAWGPSDQHPSIQTGGEAVPHSINGNHYALSTSTMAPPQSSNHIVEQSAQGKGLQYGGKHRRSNKRQHATRRRGRHHRRFIGEQKGGGVFNLLPELLNGSVSTAAGAPSNIMNSLQGASTPYRSPDATIQPINQPVNLK